MDIPMDVYDQAEALAASIEKSKEFSEYRRYSGEVELRPDACAILREYRARQFALELAEAAGEESEELNNALEDVCDRMESDDLLSSFLTAEYNFCTMIRRMQDIFSRHLGGEEIFDDAEIVSSGYLN